MQDKNYASTACRLQDYVITLIANVTRYDNVAVKCDICASAFKRYPPSQRLHVQCRVWVVDFWYVCILYRCGQERREAGAMWMWCGHINRVALLLRSIQVVNSCSRDHVILVITSSRLANGTHF